MFPHTKPPAGTQINPLHPLSRGLAGCWLFNEGAGSLANDISGNKNHGRLTNMAPNVQGSGWGGSKFGGVLGFDGVNDYMDCGSGASLDDMGPLTYSAWIYPITIDTTARYICGKCVNGGGYNRHLYLQTIDGNPRIHFVVNGASSLDVSSVDNAVVENEWQHIIMTWDGSTTATNAHIYVNGIEVSYAIQSNGSGLISDADGDFIIGNRRDTIRPFNGSIDSVHIYNRALSAEEAAWSYREPYAMFDKPLSPTLLYAAAAAGAENPYWYYEMLRRRNR